MYKTDIIILYKGIFMSIKSERLLKILSLVIFCIYIVLLVWVIMFKCNLINSIKDTYTYFKEFTLKERFMFYLVPFKDYFEGPFLSQLDTIIEDDILNVLFFLPLGIYTTFFFKKYRILKTIGIGISLSMFFELFQLFSLIGSFSTKDIITNTLGAVLGYLFTILVYRKKNHSIKIMILNILSIIVICIFVPVVCYALINTLLNANLYIDILLRRI